MHYIFIKFDKKISLNQGFQGFFLYATVKDPFEYERILERMREVGADERIFKYYIELAKQGEILKTAGAGFGVERMTRFVCQQKNIDDVTIFSRKPGKELYIF